jgi:hypothetical protein
MPLEDFLGDMFSVGGEKGGWRGVWAIFGLVIGAAVGGYIGYQSGILQTLGSAALGAFFGWFIGVMFTGLLRIALIFIALSLVFVAYFWITGQFG